MKPTNKCEAAGGIAPNGEYYGSSDPEVTYLHLGLSTALMKSGIISESRNPDRGLELNGGIKQHGGSIITLDSVENEKPMTQAQINTLRDVIGQDYMILDFVNQDKFIFIQDLFDKDPGSLHYELIAT